MKSKIATIIHYSSLDNEFIRHTIKESLKYSDVYVLSYNKFFDGSSDKKLKKFKDYRVRQSIIRFNPTKDGWWHHNNLRHKGYQLAKATKKYKAYFFLDGDEVPEGDLVSKYIEDYDYESDIKFACYWYYRDTCYQANQIEEAAVIIPAKHLKKLDFFLPGDRNSFSQNYIRYVGLPGRPLFHHYSWAKPRDVMYDKISLFGHKDDMDWKSMLDREYSQEFTYVCPFNGYTFKKVKPFINKTFND